LNYYYYKNIKPFKEYRLSCIHNEIDKYIDKLFKEILHSNNKKTIARLKVLFAKSKSIHTTQKLLSALKAIGTIIGNSGTMTAITIPLGFFVQYFTQKMLLASNLGGKSP
jgi:hypothetical protein